MNVVLKYYKISSGKQGIANVQPCAADATVFYIRHSKRAAEQKSRRRNKFAVGVEPIDLYTMRRNELFAVASGWTGRKLFFIPR